MIIINSLLLTFAEVSIVDKICPVGLLLTVVANLPENTEQYQLTH